MDFESQLAFLHKYRVFFIIDTITDITSHDIINLLAAARKAKYDKLLLIIESEGGSFFESLAIFDLISSYPGEITGYYLHAASGAALILEACHKRIGNASSSLLFHDATHPEINMYYFVNNLSKIENSNRQMQSLVMNRSCLDAKEIQKLFSMDLFLSPKSAKKSALIDSYHSIIPNQYDVSLKEVCRSLDSEDIKNSQDLFCFILSNRQARISIDIHQAPSALNALHLAYFLNHFTQHLTLTSRGITFSSKMILLQAGDIRRVAESTQLRMCYPDFCLETNGLFEKSSRAALVQYAKDIMRATENLFLSRSKNITRKKLQKLLRENTMLSPSEALDLGLIDEILSSC